MMEDKNINTADKPWVGVLGATSLVAYGLLPLLIAGNYQVAAFSRHSSKDEGEIAGISWLTPGEKLPRDEKITLWVCLAPIWVLPEHFAWIVECGAKQIVALSSTSRFTKVDSSDPAEQTLAQRFIDNEDRLAIWAESNGIAWTVLRPTLIYGLGRDKNVSQIARLIRRFGFFPLLGQANGLRQPIHLQDLAAACIAALERPAAQNRAFNVSGAEILPYREMVTRIFTTMGKQPRFLMAPLWIFRIAIAVMRILPPFRNWSPAMAERMNGDMVFDHSEAVENLGFSPRAFNLKTEDIPHQP
jgi:nucleoside-diphosphate-sugar epimerase